MSPSSPVRRRLAATLVGSLSVALTLSMGPWFELPDAAAEPTPTPAQVGEGSVTPTGSDLVRPDFVSAAVTARSSGARVEVLSERSETSRTWALPTGGFAAEASAAPVRFRDQAADHDGWRDIDTTLVANGDGSVSPKAVPTQVQLGGAGDAADQLVSTADESQTVNLGAGISTPLPAPVLDGSTATYPDVLPGVDVRVEVRPTGFEQLWVAKTRAGLELLLTEQAGGDQGVAAAMTLEDLTAKSQANGGVVFTDDANKTVAKLNPPTVWDATTDRNGDPVNVGDAAFQVVDNGDPLPPKTGATGDLELSVVPDQAWLADPARKFPVTIDPTYVAMTSTPIFDTWLQEGNTSDLSTSTVLPVGMGTNGLKNRSFLNFNTTAFKYKTVTSASLSLWSDVVGSCTANGWSAYDAGAASAASRWASAPTIGTKYATSTETKGAAACPAGLVSIDMKAQLQAWADPAVAAGTQGMALKADNETSNAGYHRFSSSEAATNQPVLNWSYSRQPSKPAPATIGQGSLYKPAGSSTSYLYTPTTQPTVATTLGSDADGDVLRGRFYAMPNATTLDTATRASYCSNNSYVASGTNVSCKLVPALPANTSFWIRAAGQDGTGLNSTYSDATEIRVASVTPAAPVISCPSYANNSWTSTAPAGSITCTVTAVGAGYSAPSAIKYSVDGFAPKTIAITQSSSNATAKTTVTVPQWTGGHSIEAYALNPAGVTSAKSTWAAGWSTPALNQPRRSDQVTTTDTVALSVSGQPRNTGSPLPAARVDWRVSGVAGITGFKAAPAGTSFTTTETGGGIRATADFDTTLLVGQTDNQGVTVAERTSTLIDLRVCLLYDTGTQCTGIVTVQRVPHAFGSNFPQADAGPGAVALWTGELTISQNDVTLPIPDGTLAVNRTHSSFAGSPSTQNGVFGPGWSASFQGDGGLGGAEVIDNTHVDGTIVVAHNDGQILLFRTPGGTPGIRRLGAALPTGLYVAADQDTVESGYLLEISGTGSATTANISNNASGLLEKHQAVASPVAGSPTYFRTTEIRNAVDSSRTTYSYDSSSRLTAMTAPLQDGVGLCVPGTPSPGCRILKMAYAATTTATSSSDGDYAGRIKQVYAQVNTDSDRILTTYKYNSVGLLVSAKDERSGQVVSYSYVGTGSSLRLASLTPPSEAPYSFEYSQNKIARVVRPNPATSGGGTAQIGSYFYGVPLSATVPGLPNMGTEPLQWSQRRTPTWMAAVFGQDKSLSTEPAPGSADWQYASLQMTGELGYTVNTAAYGNGDWQISANDYDDLGNIVRSWDERAVAQIRAGSISGAAAADDVATLTRYNDDVSEGGQVVLPAGSVVTDIYGPVRKVLSSGGSFKLLRSHLKTTYDQGAPNSGISPSTGQSYALPTKSITTAEASDGTVDSISASVYTSYDSIAPSDISGWEYGLPTTVTTDMDNSGGPSAGDLVKKIRYNSRGQLVETRQPLSNGSDAGTRSTIYYTGNTASVAACGSKPEWAGQVCQTGPVGQAAGPTLATTRMTYRWDLQTVSTTESSGGAARTTTVTYDSADRPTTVSTVASGLVNSTSTPSSTTSYDPVTGRPSGSTSTAGSESYGFDNWGRQVSYTNSPSNQAAATATSTYDAAGRLVSITDNNGQGTFVYDGTDASGRPERRGLITALSRKMANGTEYRTTAAYDPMGELSLEKLPGNLNRRYERDVTGQQTGLSISGLALNPDTNIMESDQPWFGWTNTYNNNEQLARELGPESGSPSEDETRGLTYGYDPAGRLVNVVNTTTSSSATGLKCQLRAYEYDLNGNRTNQVRRESGSDSTCPTTGGTTATRTYDTADRPISGANGVGAYTYDELGRQTTIPASDAPRPTDGNVALEYFNTDLARRITQNGTSTVFDLDQAGRQVVQKETQGSTVRTLTNYFTDSSDSPTWSTYSGTGVTSSTTRYVTLIDGSLGLTFTAVGSQIDTRLNLTDPSGNSVSSISLSPSMNMPGASSAVGIDGWSSFNEYGEPTAPGSSGSFDMSSRYGWLGANQRTSLGSGIILMGARLYNRSTGLFTSRDVVVDGNSTSYGYPTDPVNFSDTSGLAKKPKPNYKPNSLEVQFCKRNKIGCSEGFASAVESQISAGTMYKGYKDKDRTLMQNAFQHATWMIRMMFYLVKNKEWTIARAEQFAYDLGYWHEKDPKAVKSQKWGSKNSKKDMFNNKQGRLIAVRGLEQSWGKKRMLDYAEWAGTPDCRGAKEICLQVYG